MAIFSYFTILISMLVIDSLWLSTIFKPFYEPNIGHLLSNSLSIWPAIFFYLLYSFALNVFVVLPALKSHTRYREIFLLGSLFGMAAYGTYDLTNQATLKDWPLIVTIVDIIWGTFLTGAVCLFSTFLTRLYSK